MPQYVPGIGSLEPKLMAIGEAPGRLEDQYGKPFVGPTGELFDDCLNKCGLTRSEIYITNVVKYQPPFNDLSKLHLIDVDLEKSVDELWDKEIRKLKPNVILAIGETALHATTGLTGILHYRGSILLARDGKTKVVPTIHPAALFSRHSGDEEEGPRNTKFELPFVYKKLIEHDFRRAADESLSRELNIPSREITICGSSLDAFRFFEQYRHLNLAAVDIESINCVPVCVGFAFTPNHAISIPLLRHIGKHELTPMGIYELEQCWRVADDVFKRIKVIGQNFKYDEFKLCLIGFNRPNLHSDILLKTRVLFPELPDKDLGTISSLWTREPAYKQEGKEFKLGKSPISQLFNYNGKDCCIEFEVDRAQENDLVQMQEFFKVPLVSYYYDYMMKKHAFYLEMENKGFNVDHERQKELKKKYGKMREEAHAKLTELIGYEVNVKSYPQVHELLYKAMRFKRLKKNPTSEDAIIRLLNNHAKKKEQKDILETVLEERRIRTQISRDISFTPDYDGRAKTSFNISATETCRSSTSVLKKPIRPKKIGLGFHTISKHGRLAKDVRSIFIPDKGKIFLQADSSQAEARVVAVLSEDWELLEAFDKIDIHRRTAGLIFGYTQDLILDCTKSLGVVDFLEKDGPERFVGKKIRHAGNYNMGKGEFMLNFNTDAQKFEIPMTISEWKAGQMLECFHKASPRIRGTFHAQIRAALDASRTLIDPFGGVRVFNGRMDEDIYNDGFANIPQRTVAHLVQGAGIKCYEEFKGGDAEFISENHDALLLQVPENGWEPYAKILKKYMQSPIDFSLYCTLKRNYTLTIPCDIEVSDTNYGEMHKVKI